MSNPNYFQTYPQPSGSQEASAFARSAAGAGAHQDVPKAFDLSTLKPILPQETPSAKPFPAPAASSSALFPAPMKSSASATSASCHHAKGLPVSGLGNKPVGLTRPQMDFNLMASETPNSAAEKIRQVQREVHGVTSDECKNALIGVQWDVTRAVRDLKTEQLFQLGSASKEHCENLLNSLDWNLELASSILLEQSQR